MKMIAGSILVLAATILYATRWLGNVMHNSVVAGGDEAGLMVLSAGVFCLVGLGIVVVGFVEDHTGHDSESSG